ncbi:MAG: PEGA domain-containing protein [Planctomycetota bacterium]
MHGPKLAAPARALLTGVAATLFLASCVAPRRPIVLDSSPPGAEVFIDGESSGFSTPCTIQLPDEDRTVEFRLEGYETETRSWRDGERSEVVYYMDGFTNLTSWPFPLFLGARDFFGPVKVDDGEMPHRIHVRMTRARSSETPRP